MVLTCSVHNQFNVFIMIMIKLMLLGGDNLGKEN